MRKSVLLLAALVGLSAHGELSRIDADGVTETGGAAKYARMIPRTGTNGVLSATLLPPVADWASRPIARLYYASAGASTQGNGSPQYPFNTLTYALANMVASSALLMAPGDYSGTGTIASGKTVTLFGVGWQPHVTSLTITANGSSSSTSLDLCGIRVDSLVVHGGVINIRLSGATVGSLSGDAYGVTVTRMDMASRIGSSTLTHVDTYAGYRFAPESGAVVSQDGTKLITLSGARGVVVSGTTTNTIAYVSELVASTNAVYTDISKLAQTNSATIALVNSERTNRINADTGLSNNLMRVISELSGDFNSLGSTWGTQLSAINTRITSVNSALSTLSVTHTSDIDALNTSVARVRTDFESADTSLDTSLRSVIAASVSSVSDSIPGIADARATTIVNARIGDTTNSVIAAAVAQANSAATAREAVISANVTALQGRVSDTESDISSHTSRLDALSGVDDGLLSQINALRGSLVAISNRVVALESAVSDLQTWRTGVGTTINTTVNNQLQPVKTKVNYVIDTISTLTNRVYRPVNAVPVKF